jgi:hypothetical protein
MRDWPSFVNHYGRLGAAFAETGLDRADHESIISDLIGGQYCDPVLHAAQASVHAPRARRVACRMGLEGLV